MKTHCPYGHPYTPENTFVRWRRFAGRWPGPYRVRECRTCKQITESINHFKKMAAKRGGWMPPIELIIKRTEKRYEDSGRIPGRSLGDFQG
jgi:hypothetical protein